MLRFKQYITESTDASTKFEGVIVDCWNLKKDLIKNIIKNQSGISTNSYLIEMDF